MSFTDAIKTCLTQKYCCFSGRARRSEYWYFSLFSSLVSIALSIIGGMLFGSDSGVTSGLTSLASLALLLPGWGVTVRRLHDVGKSGWYILIALIPIVGAILLLVKECTDSQPCDNQYGPNPKAPPVAARGYYDNFGNY